PDIYGQTTNCNIYYDTDNWDLIRKSIEGPVYKEKLRVRSYGTPKTGDEIFIELKKKYDGIVYKRRITMASELVEKYLMGCEQLSPDTQIGKEIEYFQKMYKSKPKVYIAYDRTSYAGRENSDIRVTFDQNIRYREYALDLRRGDFGKNLLPEGMVLMEIKVPGTVPLWMAKLLSELEIKPTSYSKYGTFYKEIIVGKNRKEIRHSA
ncbi:MAG: polyphosphate polymerase domain-containing protein, partial [Clostridia bacterium]|nr:polyphosphate polymerase domain-containing protein [Clostridia bacterium]